VSYNKYKNVYGERLERLKNFGVYYWPTFSVCSKSREVALDEDDECEKEMVFEIYMTETNINHEGIYQPKEDRVPTSIDMTL